MSTYILVHGAWHGGWCWYKVVSLLEKAGHTVLAPDLPSLGKDKTPVSDVSLTMWAEYVCSLLDAQPEPAVLVGHSLGAQVAVEFAARHTARAGGMVLIDPIFKKTLHGSALWIRRFAPLIRLAIGVIRLLNLLGVRRRKIPGRDLRRLDEETRAKLLASGRQEEMVRLYTSPWEDIKFFPTANYLQEFIEVTRPLPPLSAIVIPTLVLLSRGVTFTDPKAVRRMLAPLTHVEIAAIDAYHWPLTEKPAVVRRAIEEWCAKAFG